MAIPKAVIIVICVICAFTALVILSSVYAATKDVWIDFGKRQWGSFQNFCNPYIDSLKKHLRGNNDDFPGVGTVEFRRAHQELMPPPYKATAEPGQIAEVEAAPNDGIQAAPAPDRASQAAQTPDGEFRAAPAPDVIPAAPAPDHDIQAAPDISPSSNDAPPADADVPPLAPARSSSVDEVRFAEETVSRPSSATV